MSSAHVYRPARRSWWEHLGFSVHSRTAEQVLSAYRPIGFLAEGGEDATALSVEQLRGLIEAAEQVAEEQRQAATAERRAADVAEFEGAFELPDADVAVEHGRWAGFTRGDATAWCWNLFQYEPHGFISPGAMLRAQALAKLRAGDLPEVFGYPERARELAQRGMTPRQYRQYREELGSPMFDPSDVRSSERAARIRR